MAEFHPPRWAKPAPLGSGQAADAAHFVAAPLLAASCVAMIGVVGADGDKFRWPGQALLALALAAMALIASIQYGFHERWKAKINRAVAAYNAGVTLLGAGVALCLAPPPDAAAGQAPYRWAAFAVIAAGTLGELAWTLLAPRRALSPPTIRWPILKRRIRRRLRDD